MHQPQVNRSSSTCLSNLLNLLMYNKYLYIPFFQPDLAVYEVMNLLYCLQGDICTINTHNKEGLLLYRMHEQIYSAVRRPE